MLNGKEVNIERFTLAKAMRVITLLKLLQQQVPEISKHWAEFRRDYGKDYAVKISRMDAVLRFGDGLSNVSDAEWERSGHELTVPGMPSQTEIFFEMAPLVYEKAEAVTLRLLGLLAMPNE